MIGVPEEDWLRGFEDWWFFTPWRLTDTGFPECRHVTFIFGVDEWTKMENLIAVHDVSDGKGKIMANVKGSLEKAREGYCN